MKMRCHIAVSAALALLLASVDAYAQDGNIYRWDGQQWVQQEGYGTRIAVDADGSPWVVNSSLDIYRLQNGAFQQLPGKAKDIGAGARSTWIIGSDDNVYQWNGNRWIQVPGSGTAISVDRRGAPWVVNALTEIYHREGSTFVRSPGGARDIGAGSDIWVIGTDNAIYRLAGNEWTPMGGSGTRISAGAPGTAWVVNDAGEIYRWQNGAFERIPGEASDIAVNARGEAWIIGPIARAQSSSALLLFREPQFKGNPLSITSAMRSLPGTFSQARSLQVRGGVWEICDMSGFRGRCVTVSSDVANLDAIGLRNFIGSVRPQPRARPRPRRGR